MGELATTSPPKRRRRRWLIVALLLVLTSVAWWSWPRGDARFVGKWNWLTGSGSEKSLKGTWHFYSNGSGISFNYDGKRISSFPWTVEGEHLLIGYQQQVVQNLLMGISIKGKPVLGVYLFYPNILQRFRILSSSELAIELDDPRSPAMQTLIRIPE